jgi:hypothetical protein
MSINNVSPINEVYSLYRSGGNPMILLNKMAQNNPQVKNVMSMLNQGANPQQLFYSLCQQRGVDPTTILSQFNGFK